MAGRADRLRLGASRRGRPAQQEGAGCRELLSHEQHRRLRSEEQESSQCANDSWTGFHMQPVTPELIRNLIMILKIEDESVSRLVLDHAASGFLLPLIPLSLKEEGSFHG